MARGRPRDDKISREPRQIRNRLRRGSANITADIEMLYSKGLEDWDWEELARGMPRNKLGTFSGKAPKWITPMVQIEAKRRLLSQVHGEMAVYLSDAIKTVVSLMGSTKLDDNGRPIVDAKTKLAAATFIIEHLIGKPQSALTIEAKVEEKHKAIAAAIILDDGSSQDGLVIDGDIVGDEDDVEIYDMDEEDDDGSE